ncbi:MAG: 50S ribosomal protein L19 [Candidatus Omnitrophota bacterium]
MKAIAAIDKHTVNKKIPEFRAGDSLKLYIKVKEGDKTRTQLFEGICTGRRGSGAGASFGVVKESHGDIVEKVFPLYSPMLEKIKVVQKGKFKRSKLYHLTQKR